MTVDYTITYIVGGPFAGKRIVCPAATPCVSMPLRGAFPRFAEYVRTPEGVWQFAFVTDKPKGWLWDEH